LFRRIVTSNIAVESASLSLPPSLFVLLLHSLLSGQSSCFFNYYCRSHLARLYGVTFPNTLRCGAHTSCSLRAPNVIGNVSTVRELFRRIVTRNVAADSTYLSPSLVHLCAKCCTIYSRVSPDVSHINIVVATCKTVRCHIPNTLRCGAHISCSLRAPNVIGNVPTRIFPCSSRAGRK
jgi:hypothetical protein